MAVREFLHASPFCFSGRSPRTDRRKLTISLLNGKRNVVGCTSSRPIRRCTGFLLLRLLSPSLLLFLLFVPALLSTSLPIELRDVTKSTIDNLRLGGLFFVSSNFGESPTWKVRRCCFATLTVQRPPLNETSHVCLVNFPCIRLRALRARVFIARILLHAKNSRTTRLSQKYTERKNDCINCSRRFLRNLLSKKRNQCTVSLTFLILPARYYFRGSQS